MDEEEEDTELGYSTTGEYTKVTSNLTFEDVISSVTTGCSIRPLISNQ